MMSSPQLRSPLHPAMNIAGGGRKLTTTAIHVMALDGVLNVNSLFTFAVFLGLALNPSDPNYTLVVDSSCAAASSVAEDLVAFHVYSFSSFLFSSLIATALRQAIKSTDKGGDVANSGVAEIAIKILRAGILASAFGSVFGCVFLTLALVNLVQIKLGTLACGNWDTQAAVGPLVILVPSALVIYIWVVLHAFTR